MRSLGPDLAWVGAGCWWWWASDGAGSGTSEEQSLNSPADPRSGPVCTGGRWGDRSGTVDQRKWFTYYSNPSYTSSTSHGNNSNGIQKFQRSTGQRTKGQLWKFEAENYFPSM